MSTGSTGSTFPKWQLAVLIGAPVALGLGYLYWRKSSEETLEDDPKTGKKKLGEIKDKTISIDGDSLSDMRNRSENDLQKTQTMTPLQKAQKYKNEGNDNFRNGKYDEAIKKYELAIEACPPSNIQELATFYQNRAAAYERLNQWQKVKEDCTKALDLNPKYVKVLSRRARAHEHTNDLISCLEDLTATCILEGFQNKQTLTLADRILKELGRQHAKEAMVNKKDVKPSLNFVRNYFASFTEDPIKKIDLTAVNESMKKKGFLRAKTLLDSGDYENIIVACTEEIESSESEAQYKNEATLLRATFYLITGRFADAMQDLDSIINNSETDSKIRSNALIKRASLNMQTEKADECFSDFKKAIQLDGSNADIFHHRGQVYTLLEKLDEAIVDFNKACELTPNSGIRFIHKCYAEYRLAAVNQNQFQMMAVMAQFNSAFDKFPNCVECYSLMAQVLTDQGQFQEADNYFEKASKIEPDNAQILVHRGMLQLQWTGNIEKSVQLIRKAIEIDDKCEFAYETLGTIEVQRGNLTEAVSLFDSAIDLAKSEMELVHLYSLKDAAISQISVTKRMGIDMNSLQALAASSFV
uniref:Putative translocase of outer mitochondrial membrane complex subunit n=1 Tax=Corethrella appendiculata TaxID=1370023 RepID=U5EUC8_9DIPT